MTYFHTLVCALLFMLTVCMPREARAQHSDSRFAHFFTSCKKTVTILCGCLSELAGADPRSDVSAMHTQQPLKRPSSSDTINDTARYTLQTMAHITNITAREQSQTLRIQNASLQCARNLSCSMLSSELHTSLSSPQAQYTFDHIMLAELDDQRTKQLQATIAALRANNNDQSARKLERLFSLSSLMEHPALIPQLIGALEDQGLPKLPIAHILSYAAAPYEVEIHDACKSLKTGTVIRDFRCHLPAESAARPGSSENLENEPKSQL